MVLFDSGTWVLSSLELALCVRMLSPDALLPLPIDETTAPLDHRMLDAFLHLAELGLLDPSETGYCPSAMMRKRFFPLTESGRTLLLKTDGAMLSICFGIERALLLEPLGPWLQQCRIMELLPGEWEAALRARLTEWGGAARLELRGPNGVPLLQEEIPAVRRDVSPDFAALRQILEGQSFSEHAVPQL